MASDRNLTGDREPAGPADAPTTPKEPTYFYQAEPTANVSAHARPSPAAPDCEAANQASVFSLFGAFARHR